MRVVRINHKAGFLLALVVCLVGLLFLLSRRQSHSNINVINSSLPTRSVDFVNIANQAVVAKRENQIKAAPHVHQTVDKSGKPGIRSRNKPGLPKPRISDGIVDGKVVKHVVHGDDQAGDFGRNQRQKHVKPYKSNHKQVMQTTKALQQIFPYTIAVLVIACNRPDAVKRCLDGLIKHRPSVTQFPIIVSQDCGDKATADAIASYGNKVKHIRQPDLSNVNVPANMGRFKGYYKISRHYKWALGQVFDEMSYDTVLIVEDDLDIAPDFFDYFLATRPLLDEDPTIWCVSAWNDNGKKEMVDEISNGLLYRADFFPGLGWMMTKSLWSELKGKWPPGFWDDWMRESAQRQGRACIRPEISRTKTFGRVGVSQGQFFDQHLKHIVLNNKKFDFLHEDLSYLIKETYDSKFLSKVSSLPVVSVEDVEGNRKSHKAVRVTYSSEWDFNSVARKLGAMTDFKAGVPRTGYHGIVTFIFSGVRVYLTPKRIAN